MISDCFLEQGTTHEICEDYVIAKNNYIILSDGCSNSGGPKIDTDFGSRLFCKSAEQHIEKFNNLDVFLSSVYSTAKTQCLSIPNIPLACLTATLLVVVNNEESFKGVIVGDGIIGARTKDKEWQIYHHEYIPGGSSNKSAPCYLKYYYENEISNYMSVFGGNKLISKYSGDLKELKKIESCETSCIDNVKDRYTFNKEQFDFAFIISDGIDSFVKDNITKTSKNQENVKLIDVLKIILDLPKRQEFLKMQKHWCFKRNSSDNFKGMSWHNTDDISMGGIYA